MAVKYHREKKLRNEEWIGKWPVGMRLEKRLDSTKRAPLALDVTWRKMHSYIFQQLDESIFEIGQISSSLHYRRAISFISSADEILNYERRYPLHLLWQQQSDGTKSGQFGGLQPVTIGQYFPLEVRETMEKFAEKLPGPLAWIVRYADVL